MFRESLEKENALAPKGHPVRILMEEHTAMVELANRLVSAARKHDWNKIREIAQHLKTSETHYLREENVLFPYLEKHGIKEPPAVMWMEHDRIREAKKRLCELVEKGDDEALKELQGFSVLLSTRMTK